MLTDFTIITRSLRARMFSTVTTAISVAVAVGLMLVLWTMQDAGRRAFQQGSGNMHLLVSGDPSGLVAVLNQVFYANPPQKPIDWGTYLDLKQRFPFAWTVPVQLGDSYRGLPVLATTEEFFTKFQPTDGQPWELAAGEFFRTSDFFALFRKTSSDVWPPTGAATLEALKSYKVAYPLVVGAEAARTRGLEVGTTLFLTHGAPGAEGAHEHREFTFTVIGVLKPTGSAHDRALFTDLVSSWIIHAHDRLARGGPRTTHPTLLDLRSSETTGADNDTKITGIYARLITREGSNVTSILPQVFDALRRDGRLGLTPASPVAEVSRLFDIVSNVNIVFKALAAVVLLSGGITIMIALYNSMEQRRRQIAVLRVLGCSQARIFGLVVTEAAMLGAIGAVLGVLLHLVGIEVVSAVLKQRFGVEAAGPFDLTVTLVVCLGAVALASIAGIVPAMMAYRTPVAKNLRPLG
jgi:putative ABC transport system permease protein